MYTQWTTDQLILGWMLMSEDLGNKSSNQLYGELRAELSIRFSGV